MTLTPCCVGYWRIVERQVVLRLCGSTNQIKAGIVTAVAEGVDGEVLLQCLLSVSLLYPQTIMKQGQVQLKPLSCHFAEYNTFRLLDLASRPAATEQVVALPRTHAPFLIWLDSNRFSMPRLPISLEAALDWAQANQALCLATVLAHSGQQAGRGL